MGMITFRLSAFEGRLAPVHVCPKSPPSDRHAFTSLQGIHIYIYVNVKANMSCIPTEAIHGPSRNAKTMLLLIMFWVGP